MSLELLNQYILVTGWIFALAIILSIAFPVFVMLFNKLTGQVDVWKELKKKNTAVAIVMAGALIGLSLIIALNI
ncbi:DUF350 domain-containing protein [Patescibacteria group bacterium]